MITLSLLLTATLFGGMVFYSFGFAPVLFAQLPMEKVRPILRGTFPYYYLAVIALSALATIVAIFVSGFSAIVLGAICLSTVYARQGLMPMINRAADAGDKAAFGRLHGASVVIQLIQIGLCGWVVAVIGWL